MKPIRKQRLKLVVFIVVGVAAAVGWPLCAEPEYPICFSPMQVIDGEAPVDQRMRLGGMVVKGAWCGQSNHSKCVLTLQISKVPSMLSMKASCLIFSRKGRVLWRPDA